MLDIKFLRENVALVLKDLEKRRDEEKQALVHRALELDAQWRTLKGDADALRSQRNQLSKQINTVKKEGGDIAALLVAAKELPQDIARLEEETATLEGEIRQLLLRIPNVMDESVPYGKDDTENVVIKHFGKKPTFTFTPKNHTELIEQLGIVDLERAAKIAGSRFYFLKGDLALLELALMHYAMEFMSRHSFTPVVPPHMMNREAYEGVTDLGAFEDTLYKVADEDLHLIATSEHPLTAQFMGETFEAASLPVKLVGLSPCYRKEAGSHGKEEKGIWRVHQFNKIEQIVICAPENSHKHHEEITQHAIAFFESLGLHFRQVLICTGDLGIVAAKKYDLEAWIPSVNDYKEIVSSSNCTAYQAVRLNIRYRDGNETKWVHTLNSTCVATTRALVAIIEQFQEADGSIRIPEPLRKYLGGREHVHPVRPVRFC